MTAETLIGISIAITIIVALGRFAIWIAWPRKSEDEMSHPHGDVVHWEDRR